MNKSGKNTRSKSPKKSGAKTRSKSPNRKTRRSKYTFTLKGINIAKVHHIYDIDVVTYDEFEKTHEVTSTKKSKNTTKLTALNVPSGNEEVISFLDESKRVHRCYNAMIDFNSNMKVSMLRYNCFWCRNAFDTHPIGCPIGFRPAKVTRRYESQISKDVYSIKEDITPKKCTELQEKIANKSEPDAETLTVDENEYYETDGVFCSFNCCQAWINDNKTDPKYRLSNMLLLRMYNNITGTKTNIITPAPHWRTLTQYGGHLNIVQFRDSFNKIEFQVCGTTKKIPNFLPTGVLFEENIKF